MILDEVVDVLAGGLVDILVEELVVALYVALISECGSSRTDSLLSGIIRFLVELFSPDAHGRSIQVNDPDIISA